MVNTIEEYIDQFEGEKKEWLVTFVDFMRQNYPEIPGTIAYKMPLYPLSDDSYIAFSASKAYFSYHTHDYDVIEEAKTQLPKVNFGKGCARVRYSNRDAIPALFELSRKIVARSREAQ